MMAAPAQEEGRTPGTAVWRLTSGLELKNVRKRHRAGPGLRAARDRRHGGRL